MPYKVNQIFYSIQGEGPYVGTPVVFCRFAGCNLNCGYCDTDHNEVNMVFDTPGELKQAIRAADTHDVDKVVFTGGEPLLQLAGDLLNLFFDFNFVGIETNGTISSKSQKWEERDVNKSNMSITVSPKLGTQWAEDLCPNVVKVIDEGQDLQQYIDFYDGPWVEFFLQPKWKQVWDIHPFTYHGKMKESFQKTAQRVLDNPGWNLSMQTHKWIGIR